MDCITCPFARQCRTDVIACKATKVDREAVQSAYHAPDAQRIVQAAAKLVDGGRAGTLSRIEETVELAREAGYRKVGLAYCYGMEREAQAVVDLFRAGGVRIKTVSCTAGAMAQKDVNAASELPGVSCNPLSQAEQLMADGVDLAVTMGLCLGHDILFQRQFRGDVTNLVVKDRTTGHKPLEAIRRLAKDLETS